MEIPDNYFGKFIKTVVKVVDGPVTWVKESVVEPNQQKYNWYHKKYRRVPTIDQCYTDDPVCAFEADQQFVRDKHVDDRILSILRSRYEDCAFQERDDAPEKCAHLYKIYEENAANWYAKYGDLGAFATSMDAYMKQKHRMIWERRYGPVGSGMNRREE